MPQGPSSPKPTSGSRRGSSDLVRLYLQDIGRVDLLSHEEELTLARQVQRRERLLRELAADEYATYWLLQVGGGVVRMNWELGSMGEVLDALVG